MFEEAPLEGGLTDTEYLIVGPGYQQVQGARRQAQGEGVNDHPRSRWLGFSAIGRKDKKGRQYFLR